MVKQEEPYIDLSTRVSQIENTQQSIIHNVDKLGLQLKHRKKYRSNQTMTEQKTSYSDLSTRVDQIENTQVAIIHSIDQLRAENNARLTAMEKSLATLLESHWPLAELIMSRLSEPVKEQR